MDIHDFRLMHSELIEQYQFIEFHLEGIYACLCREGFFPGLEQVERDNIGKLMKRIKQLEEECSVSVFTESEWQELEYMAERRNFWCHACYVNMVFDARTGGPKRDTDIKALLRDRNDAVRIRERLYHIKLEKMPKR